MRVSDKFLAIYKVSSVKISAIFQLLVNVADPGSHLSVKRRDFSADDHQF